MSRDLLTIGLDDYFHAGALKRYIQPQQWYRFEMRIEQNTLKTLDVLDQHKVGATFFVMGWIADKRPDLVKEVARRGHEIANLGYYHRTIHEMTRAEFIEDLDRSEEALERAVGHKPRGYRLARAISRLEDLWVLDLLAQRGYSYDCSVMPVLRSFCRYPAETTFASSPTGS
jgi:polysaccharide deacetylase family protein (PEP-CTERM system associated)